MPNTRSAITLFFCSFLAFSSFSQRPADLKRDGEKAYNNSRWSVAKALLSQYQDAKPGNYAVLTKLGIVNYHLGQGAEARRYLEYVAAKAPNRRDPDLFYYLARTLHGLSDWDKAIAAYKFFLRICGNKHALRDNAADNIRRCVNGMRIPENESVVLVENLGISVNSAGDEFAPLPSLNHADRLYYAAARNGCIGGLRNEDGYEDADRGQWSSDMFAAKLTNRGWQAAGSLGGLLNTSRFEVPLGFNSDGQVLYFFRGFSTYSGEILADTAAKKDEYALQAPAFSSPMQAEEGDCSPYFVNENTIVFASRRKGGQGGLDLWYTTYADSSWMEPRNFGPTINSAYDETTPFLALDGRSLYFSSNRPESMGGLDVFHAVFDDKKMSWTAPANMGTPVSSPGNDAFFRISKDAMAAFFSSDRLGGNGERDIYIAYFKEAAPAQTSSSTPEFFWEIAPEESLTADQVQKVAIPAILYQDEGDLLSKDNLKTIDGIAAIARQHPEATVLITLFTEDSGQSKFDIYYGIKRAEILGEALTTRGVAASKIVLRSVGSAFPIARVVIGGVENPIGLQLNRRAEMIFTAPEPLRFDFQLERPVVADMMATKAVKELDQQTSGLAFRVEATLTRQVLTNDALAMFGDLMIESHPGVGTYRYTAGYFKQYQPAAKLCTELQGLGFTEARTIAYINGIRVSRAEAVGLVKKYPDIGAFIKG